MNNIVHKIKRYFRGAFRGDLTAGLTVAMVVIPQSMAYAAIVGINPIYGLFTAVIPTIIGSIVGSFPFLVTGPTNPTALVTASVLIAYADNGNYLEFVFALAIIAGLVKIILGALKLGQITRYISNSVLVGFLTGVGLLIIGGQLGNLLGVNLSETGGLLGVFKDLYRNFQYINLHTCGISLVSLATMVGLRIWNRKLPASLITIIISSLLVYFLGWGNEERVLLVNSVGLPENVMMNLHIPEVSLKNIWTLGFSGVAVALFTLMETLSVTKSMHQMTGEDFDPSREMMGQGLASFVGGFFQCMPSSGSPSRTVVNVVNGARTRFASVISGLSVFIFLLLFSGMIGYIPLPSLAAVVIVSAAGLINVNLIEMTWQSRLPSRIVMVATFIATLVLPLEYAIYLGILLTILIYLSESGRVKLSYIVEDDVGQFIELPLEGLEQQNPRIAIVNVEGDLYFAAATDLEEQMNRIFETDVKVLVLRFRRTHLLASTGVMALDTILKNAQKHQIVVLFCGLLQEVQAPLESGGILGTVGPENVFLANHQIFTSTHEALQRAKEILKNFETA